WLKRLREAGVELHTRHRWQDWDEDQRLVFDSPEGRLHVRADAVVLALGGGSWARLGSDGAWVPWLRQRGVDIRELRPANCGFTSDWSEHLRQRFSGQPLKQVIARVTAVGDQQLERRGECVVTESGLEGSLIYALSAELRDLIEHQGHADLHLDLAPDRSQTQLSALLAQPRKGQSLAAVLRKRAGLDPLKTALLHECLTRDELADPQRLAKGLKHLPIRLTGTRPLDEAISSAGGVTARALNEGLMLNALPGVFCAGEMLDWEAPTGGYLLTACFASGRVAAEGVIEWLKGPSNSSTSDVGG